MKQEIFVIKSQKKIAKDVFKMVLSGNTDDITASGQFVNIKLDGFYLRRPISVCDYDKNEDKVNYVELKVYLSQTHNQKEVYSILLHEMTHAWDNYNNIPYPLQKYNQAS